MGMFALAAGMRRPTVIGAEMHDLLEIMAECPFGERPDHLALEFVEFDHEIAGSDRRPAEGDGRGRDTDWILDETGPARACWLRFDLILDAETVEFGQTLLVAAAQRRSRRCGDMRSAGRQHR